jgi:hypothetical protein
MMRLACVFALVALVALFALIIRLDGATAIVFSFIGMPSLALALAIYVFARWRAGAFTAPSSD